MIMASRPSFFYGANFVEIEMRLSALTELGTTRLGGHASLEQWADRRLLATLFTPPLTDGLGHEIPNSQPTRAWNCFKSG